MTTEMIQKAKACKSADELLALAKENGYDMTAEEAAARFEALNNEGEMADDELENAAGGGCGNSPELEEGMTVKWSGKKARHSDTCSCPDLFVVKCINKRDSRYGRSVWVDIACTECNIYSYSIKPGDLYIV